MTYIIAGIAIIVIIAVVKAALATSREAVRIDEKRRAAEADIEAAVGQARFVDRIAQSELQDAKEKENHLIDKMGAYSSDSAGSAPSLLNFPELKSIDLQQLRLLNSYKAADNIRFAVERYNLRVSEARELERRPFRIGSTSGLAPVDYIGSGEFPRPEQLIEQAKEGPAKEGSITNGPGRKNTSRTESDGDTSPYHHIYLSNEEAEKGGLFKIQVQSRFVDVELPSHTEDGSVMHFKISKDSSSKGDPEITDDLYLVVHVDKP